MEGDNISSGSQLRRVLNVMFTSSYIQLYHQPPNSICSPLSIKCCPSQEADNKKDQRDIEFNTHHLEPSTEPSLRSGIISLREHLNTSLVQHQAKSVGLCPIRRAIYDQCFGGLKSFQRRDKTYSTSF